MTDRYESAVGVSQADQNSIDCSLAAGVEFLHCLERVVSELSQKNAKDRRYCLELDSISSLRKVEVKNKEEEGM